MALTRRFKIRDVRGLEPRQRQRIMDFLQGAVYCWCKNRSGDWFSLRELMGGDNSHWEGTPLMPLYDKQMRKGHNQRMAGKRAGIDGGWLLKKKIYEEPARVGSRIQKRNKEDHTGS